MDMGQEKIDMMIEALRKMREEMGARSASHVAPKDSKGMTIEIMAGHGPEENGEPKGTLDDIPSPSGDSMMEIDSKDPKYKKSGKSYADSLLKD